MELEQSNHQGMITTNTSYSSPWSVHTLDSNSGNFVVSNQLVSASGLQPILGNIGNIDERNENNDMQNSEDNASRKKRKYVKKSIEKFLKQGAGKKQTDLIHRKGVEQQYTPFCLTPIYNHITEKIDFILIGGDFFYKFSLSDEERDLLLSLSQNNLSEVDEEDRQNALQLISHAPAIMNQYKEIVEIQKHDKYILIRMANKIDGLKEFQNLISQLSEASQELVGGESILNPLIELQKIIKACQVTIQGIVRHHENDTERLLQKQQKRVKYIEKYVKDKILASTLCKSTGAQYHQEVFTLGFINIDFVQCIPVLRKVLYSSEYIKIMGCSLDEAVNQFIRQGIKETYDLQTRMRIQQGYIKSVLTHSVNAPIKIDDIKLLTFDNISIKCTGEIKLLQIEIPTSLKYNETNLSENLLEQVYMLKLNIPSDVVEKIQVYRNGLKAGQEQTSSPLLEQEEFRYSIQSQVFIERFYQNQEQQNEPFEVENNDNQHTIQNVFQQIQSDSKSSSEQQSYEEEEDQTKTSRCKFKIIS